MKKIICLIIAMLVLGTVQVQAQQPKQEKDWEAVFEELEREVQETAKPVARERQTRVPAASSNEKLVDLDSSRAKTRIDDLERRVSQLERDQRFQDERIRNLDREINELRRRK